MKSFSAVIARESIIFSNSCFPAGRSDWLIIADIEVLHRRADHAAREVAAVRGQADSGVRVIRQWAGDADKRLAVLRDTHTQDVQTKKSLKERLQDFFGHQNPSLKAEDPFEEVTENGNKHYKAKFNVFARSDNNA